MANYQELKDAISKVIKTNGNQEITGAVLQNALLSIINNVGKYSTFIGIARTNSNPGTQDGNVFLIAGDPGVYVNLGGFTLNPYELGIIKNTSGTWALDVIKLPFSVYQVDKYFTTDGTLENAVSFIPNDRIKKGDNISFLSNGKELTYKFIGSNFTNEKTLPNKWIQLNDGMYPFVDDYTKYICQDAVIDIYIETENPDIKLALFTLQHSDAGGLYVRLIYVDENGNIDNSKGSNGVAALYTNTENSNKVEKIKFSFVYGDVKSAYIVVDWSKVFNDGKNYGNVNGNRIISKLCYIRASSQVTIKDVFDSTPIANEIVWSQKTYFPDWYWMRNFVKGIKLYGEKQKNTCVGMVNVTLNGRMFITIHKFDDGATTLPSDSASQICLADISTWNLPIEENGHYIEKLELKEKNSSGASGYIVVDWSALPILPNSQNQIYRNAAIENAILSYNIWTEDEGKKRIIGSVTEVVQINGVNATIITPNDYVYNGAKSKVCIYCHGNGQGYKTKPSATGLEWLKQHNIGYAVIQIQDYTTAPFGSNASGWGNDITYYRILWLYNYLMEYYNFEPTIILAGGSMGGLTMGQLAYKKPFPIYFCLGLGVVPGVKIIFNNAAGRRPAIRNAYGMNENGDDDAEIAKFVQGNDWYDMGLINISDSNIRVGFPNFYLYYGNDNTFRVDFGGITQYEKLYKSFINGGVYSIMEQVGAIDEDGHATDMIWDKAIEDKVFENELGII